MSIVLCFAAAEIETKPLRVMRAEQTASGEVQTPHEDLGEFECEWETLLHDLREMTFVMSFPQVKCHALEWQPLLPTTVTYLACFALRRQLMIFGVAVFCTGLLGF